MHRIVVITVKTRRVYFCAESDGEWLFKFMCAKCDKAKTKSVAHWYNEERLDYKHYQGPVEPAPVVSDRRKLKRRK
jgi:lysyl-tRNA synthetase class I